MSPVEHKNTITVSGEFKHMVWHAAVTIREVINLSTGDAVENVSIDEFIDATTGQTIHTKTLLHSEFRTVVDEARRKVRQIYEQY